MAKKSTTGLSVKQAVLIGAIPALITALSSVAVVLISEQGEFRRQEQVINASQTSDALDREFSDALDPPPPPTVEPTAPPTITPVPTGATEPAPLQTIRAYYSSLNSAEYLAAWNQLSDRFQEVSLFNNYPAYESFWVGAGLVSVVELEPVAIGEFESEILVRLYWEAERRTRAYRYFLILDLSSREWLIDRVDGA